MTSDLFDLHFPNWGTLLLFTIPALVNFGLFAYASATLPPYRVNKLFSFFILLLGIAQLTDGFMHMSNTIGTAMLWQRMAFASWVFVVPIGVFFILCFQKKPAPKSVYAVLLLPAIVMELLIIGRETQFDMLYTETWAWIANPRPVLLNMIIYGYMSIGALLMPVLLWIKWRKSEKGSRERSTFHLLAIGITIPYIAGLIGEVLLPLVLHGHNVPLAGPFLTIFSVCAMVAIRKYKLLAYSPRHHSDHILDTTNDGILISDNSGKIMYANPALGRLLSCDLQEIMGVAVDKFIPAYPALIKSGFTTAQEFQVADRNGKLIWVVASLSPCTDHRKQVIGAIWTLTNIDTLKKKGLEIIRNETRLNRAQEIAHMGHWELDFSSGLATWSTEACRIYGLAPQDRLQSFSAWISFIHPEDLPFVISEIDRGRNTRSDTDFQHRILLRDGTVKHIRSISRIEFDEHQRPIGLYGVCHDITEIKQTQDRLQATSSELETYIYKSSHDLHAPLSTILGLINVSKKDISDPVAKHYLSMIEAQTTRLDAIRKEFIKAIQIKSAEKFDEQVSLSKMVSDILENMKCLTGYERLNINVNIPQKHVLFSNEYLLRTILENLVENSVKYQNYNQAHPFIDINFIHGQEHDSIVISDNGVGMNPEIQGRVFEMYFKGTESGTGSGLGLYLVKQAVDKLNGNLHLRSSEGLGTTFTVQLAQAC